MDKVVFIAEKEKIKHFTPYWKWKNEEEKEENNYPHARFKYLYNDTQSQQSGDFGECLTNKMHPVIVVFALKEKKFTILDIQSFKEKGLLESDGKFQ